MENPILKGIEKGEKELEKESEEESILLRYYNEIDPHIREKNWGYLEAKSIEYGKIDQSLLNHVRNGVSFLSQLWKTLEELEVDINDSDLERVIALFVIHDLHKVENKDFDNEFDIDESKVKDTIEAFGLKNFTDLSMEDYYSCVKASHRSDNSKTGRLTPEYSRLASIVRLADGIASSSSPEKACGKRNQRILEEKFDKFKFSYHKLEEVKGILTNIINRSIADYLETRGYHLLTIYDNGCIYLTRKDNEEIDFTEEAFESIYKKFIKSLRNSHKNLSDPSKLSEAITGGRLGSYKVSSEYYFYSGVENIVKGFCFKGYNYAQNDRDPTDSMISDIELGIDITGLDINKDSREVIGFSRIVASIHKEILSLENSLNDSLNILGQIFNASDDTIERLKNSTEKERNKLSSGGKWIYSIPIASEFLNSKINGKKVRKTEPKEISDYVSERLLNHIDKDIIESQLFKGFEKEIKSFLSDLIILNRSKYGFESPDVFDEYVKKSTSKICSICNRSTFGNKGDMESKKSLHGLQAGFSNFVDLGSSKPEKLLLCKPCQVEFGLRNIETNPDQEYRIFYHFIPDYFYTPVTWKMAETIVQRMGNGNLQILKIAQSIVSDEFGKNLGDDFEDVAGEGSGWDVIESTIGEFKNNYGTQILEYHRNSSDENPLNDTSVHFLGILTGLVAAQLSGSRVMISEKPINPYPSTSFKEFAKIDCGKNQVLNVTGSTVSLSELEDKLKAFSSIVDIVYSLNRKDSLFAKYLRVCRNNELPGSYLLKRLIRESDNQNYSFVINVHLEESNIIDLTLGDTMTKNKLDKLSELGYRVAIPKTYKPYAVERPFRESVKAITKTSTEELGKQDYKNLVTGRLRKGLERGSQTYSMSKDDLDTEEGWGERIEEFADYFVEEIFYGLCDGNPGKLKRKANNFADGYYSGILRRKNKS